VYVTGAFPYARSTGMGAAFKASLTPLRVVAASLLAALALAVAIGLVGLPVPLAIRVGGPFGEGLGLGLAALVVASLFGRYVLTKIAGLTGDSYGATNELVELTALLLLNVRA
jgi:adenosylcobinamide-GDP ribazoletransferase